MSHDLSHMVFLDMAFSMCRFSERYGHNLSYFTFLLLVLDILTFTLIIQSLRTQWLSAVGTMTDVKYAQRVK